MRILVRRQLAQWWILPTLPRPVYQLRMPAKVRNVPNPFLKLPLNSMRLIYQVDGCHEPGSASLLRLADLLAVSRVLFPSLITIYLSHRKLCSTSLMLLGYYNYLSWMQTWALINENGTGESTDIIERPQAVAMLYDNTTVQGSWVMANSSNITANYDRFVRIVNNVTMAMPHAGVYAAALDPKNNIMQPSELDGVGGYLISASVVSPAVNVLCVNMAENELEPLVYTLWPYANLTNSTQIPGQQIPVAGWTTAIPAVGSNGTWLNSTAVDDIFFWGEKYGRRPPVFEMVSMLWHDTCTKAYLAPAPNGIQHNYERVSVRSGLSLFHGQ